MRLTINGEYVTCTDALTVLDLLKELGFLPKAVVVEHNAEVLERSKYETTVLSEGDSLELIRFVGGG